MDGGWASAGGGAARGLQRLPSRRRGCCPVPRSGWHAGGSAGRACRSASRATRAASPCTASTAPSTTTPCATCWATPRARRATSRADDHGYGFDNNADVLSMSPLLMEKYSHAAEKLVEAAWSDRARCGTCALDPADPLPCARDILAALRPPRLAPAGDARRRWSGWSRFVALAKQHGDGAGGGREAGAARGAGVAALPLPRGAGPGARRPLRRTRSTTTSWPAASPTSSGAACRTRRCWRPAEAGTLHEPEELEAQVRRMLADPKARGAGGQLRRPVALHARARLRPSPDAALYPASTTPLRAGHAPGDAARLPRVPPRRPPAAATCWTRDFTYVNDRLAAHYGLPRAGHRTR